MGTNVSCLIVRRIYYQNKFFTSGTSASISALLYSVGAQCDDGPFYLTPKKREALRISNEFLLPPEKQGDKDKTKRELVDEMMNTPFGIAEGRNALLKMLFRDLQKSAVNLGIVTKKHVTHRTVSGWEGRGKGMLQGSCGSMDGSMRINYLSIR